MREREREREREEQIDTEKDRESERKIFESGIFRVKFVPKSWISVT